MINTIDLRDLKPSRAELIALVPRSLTDVSAATAIAQELISDVRERGEAALLDQAERFDGVRPQRVRMDVADVSAAVRALSMAWTNHLFGRRVIRYRAALMSADS